MDPSYVSFGGSNDGPPEGALLGDSLEETGGWDNLWSVFEEFLRLASEELKPLC